MSRDLSIEELDAEMEALDRVEDATITLLGLKPGHILTEAEVADLVFLDEYHRKEEETAIDTFHRGYQAGLARAVGTDVAKLIEERDSARNSAAASRAFQTASARWAFIEGAQVCREMMARFVEQNGGTQTAKSIRANWRPSWGDDPGPPNEKKYQAARPIEISCKEGDAEFDGSQPALPAGEQP